MTSSVPLNKRPLKLIENRLYASVLLFIVSFTVFMPSLRNGFVWDDIPYILSRIDSLTISRQLAHVIPQNIKDESKKRSYYRPTLHVSLAVDNSIWKGRPIGFHLSNILMHSMTTVLLFLLIQIILSEFRYVNKAYAAFAGSLLFALHPMHVESVSFIMARSDLLCAVFLFAFLICYIKSYEKIRYLFISIIFFGLALVSKEVAFVIPALVVLYDIIRPGHKLKDYMIRYSFFALMFLVYVLIRKRAFIILPEVSEAVASKGVNGLDLYYLLIKNFLSAYGFYLYKLVYPFDFNVATGRVAVNISYIIAGLSSFILLVLFVYRKNRFYLFSLGLIILSVLPAVYVSVLDVVTSPYSERFLYIPSAGFCMITGYLIVDSYRKFNFSAYVPLSTILLISIVFIQQIIKEQFVWENNYTLWSRAVKRSPENPMASLNLGYSLMEKGDYEGAVDAFSKSIIYEEPHKKTQMALAYNNLGSAYLNKGDYDLAGQSFEKAYKSAPEKYKLTYMYNKGLIYYLKGNRIYTQDETKAEEFYRAAIEQLVKTDKDAHAHNGRLQLLLAESYLRLQDFKSAHKYAQKSLEGGQASLDDNLRERAQSIMNFSEQYK